MIYLLILLNLFIILLQENIIPKQNVWQIIDQKKTEELGDQDADDKKKRFRRIASQIDRHYKCPNTIC